MLRALPKIREEAYDKVLVYDQSKYHFLAAMDIYYVEIKDELLTIHKKDPEEKEKQIIFGKALKAFLLFFAFAEVFCKLNVNKAINIHQVKDVFKNEKDQYIFTMKNDHQITVSKKAFIRFKKALDILELKSTQTRIKFEKEKYPSTDSVPKEKA